MLTLPQNIKEGITGHPVEWYSQVFALIFPDLNKEEPGATTATTDYAFLVRTPDGSVSVAHDTHVLGLFPRETWLRVLTEAGFTARSVAEVTQEDRLPREFFVGSRPGEGEPG